MFVTTDQSRFAQTSFLSAFGLIAKSLCSSIGSDRIGSEDDKNLSVNTWNNGIPVLYFLPFAGAGSLEQRGKLRLRKLSVSGQQLGQVRHGGTSLSTPRLVAAAGFSVL